MFAIAIPQKNVHNYGHRYGRAMTRFFIGACLVAMLVPAAAQNARPALPENGPKLLENEQIKVHELRLKAGTRTESRNFPNTFLYALTDGALVFVPPGRTPYELTFKSGEALWLSAQQAAIANEGESDIRALLVEIKQRPVAAAKPRGTAKASGGKSGKSSKGKPTAKPSDKGKKK